MGCFDIVKTEQKSWMHTLTDEADVAADPASALEYDAIRGDHIFG